MLDKAQSLLAHYFGYDSLRAGQKQAIQSVTEERKNTVCIMPTGAENQSAIRFPHCCLKEPQSLFPLLFP
ncbi:Hypothetical protein ACI5QL_02094 [Bacillus velezensis]